MSQPTTKQLLHKKDQKIAQLEQTLALEAALEKVRMRTMTMQKSEELAEVASLAFQQLEAIGLVNSEERFHFSLHDEQTYNSTIWMTKPGGKKMVKGFEFQATKLFYPLDRDYTTWKNTPIWERKKLLTNTIYEGEALKKLLALMKSNSNFASNSSNIELLENPPSQIVQNAAHFSHGVVCVSSSRQFPKEKLQILQRFAITFEQTYIRFLDLQKAEAQAKEAQIEAALERVRAASMAMHKSEDLPEVALVTVSQLEVLGIQQFGSSISIADESNDTFIMYSAHDAFDERGKVLSITKPLAIDTNPIYREVTSQIQKGNNDFSFEIKGKVLKGWIEHNKTNIDKVRGENIEKANLKKFYGNVAAFRGLSSLSISSAEAIKDADRLVLRRMADVFGQSYQRYLDLQKAEAQVREAQIETALERIRSRSMAMHKSEELSEVALVVFQQLESLGIQARQSWIAILRESEDYGDAWSSLSKTESMVPNKVTLSLQHPTYQLLFQQWKNGVPFWSSQFEGAEVAQHFQMVNEMVAVPVYNLDNLPPYIEHFEACHQYGMLSIEMDTQIEQSIKDIVLRFAKVFEQTYTRFLDLERAEEQARKAQIEASLERIRAASMAMHHSDELTQVCQVFLSQIEHLAIPLLGVSIALMNEDTRNIMQYVVDNTKKNQEQSLFSFEHNVDDFSVSVEYVELAKKGNTEFSMTLGKKRIAEWIAWVGKFMGTERAERLKKANLEKIYFHMLTFHGWSSCVNFSSSEELSVEHWSVMRRLVNTFAMSYRRFLDLQKAEAQAREAQIEAALERVRASTMAMHHSSDLTSSAGVLLAQIQSLGAKVMSSGFVLCEENNLIDEQWMFTGGVNNIVQQYIPHEEEPVHHNMFKAWQSGEQMLTQKVEGEVMENMLHFLMAQPSVRMNLEKIAAADIPWYDRQILHAVYFSKGYLLIVTTEEFPEKEIFIRFAKVFEQTYTRFLDLQKAEAQAREAQIEVALERVRAANMSMHSSNDLNVVISVTYEQLKVLDIPLGVCTIQTHVDKGLDFVIWISIPGKTYPQAILVPYKKHPMFDRHIMAKAEMKKFFSDKLTKREKNSFYRHLFNSTKLSTLVEESRKERILAAKRFDRTVSILKNSAFTVHNFDGFEYEDKDIAVIIRLHQVFEQGYSRYLDLQKAEAQAKEAQIEAALEKVRAKTASMYKSTELEAVVSLVFQQLRLLDFDSKQCIIGIIDKETLETEIWQSVDAQSGLPNSYKIPKLDHPFIQKGYDSYLKGEQYHERELSGTAKKSYDKLIFEQTDLKNVPAEVKAAIIQNKKIVTGSAYMSHGVIQVIGAEALSAEKAHILQRFAAAIDLTYTRFLDIQKAETQKIQLEKVFNENQRLLHSILPKPIAEQIRQGQQTVVKRFEQVSILFADIVGFTILSERLSPQEVVDILNGLFSQFDDLTDKYGLEKIKTIGDAYMVAAGVPEEKEDHAQRIFAFAKDMLQTLQGYNKIIGTDLKIRIGISSGPVVAGVIGKKKFAYDLWGDTVNTAARMEAYGQADCIQLAPSTYEILKDGYEFEKIPDVEIKGKGKMDVYLWKD